jgi:hypothetical protein
MKSPLLTTTCHSNAMTGAAVAAIVAAAIATTNVLIR